jgi:probable F420-dependent oxidoreductase
MKFDLFLYDPTRAEIPARARQAELGGFDGLFVAETRSDPFQALALAALDTTRVDLGTGIALAFPRSPMLTAVAAWDLHRASEGRFVLGLGSQVRRHIERRFSAEFEHPAARLGEYTRALRHVWGVFQGEHPLEFRGDFYALDYLTPAVNPGPLPYAPPPIYLAAFGPLMFETSGAVADGVIVHPVHTVDYLSAVAEPAIARGLARAGRDRADFAVSVTALCIVAEGDGVAGRESVRRQFGFYASTPAYRPALELHGWGGLGDELRDLVRRGAHDALAAAVPDAALDTFCIVAEGWGEAIGVARRRYAGVADRVAFQAAPPLDVRAKASAIVAVTP